LRERGRHGESERGRPAADCIEFRIGIPAGDILKDNDIFGQRVNIAARLERSSSPGASVSRFGCDPRSTPMVGVKCWA
jgi:class 3 adenylate cyclase